VLVPFSAADAVVAEGEIDAAGDADDRESQSRGQRPESSIRPLLGMPPNGGSWRGTRL
jgi:hypothetical protein